MLCCAYYAWLLFGPPKIRNIVLAALALTTCVLIPLNYKATGFADWYDQGMTAVERDLRAGMPRLALAERHKDLLLHWNVEALKANLALLRDTGKGPFRELREDAPDANGSGK